MQLTLPACVGGLVPRPITREPCNRPGMMVYLHHKEDTMARTRKDIENRRKLKDLRALRGHDRQAHFETGGTLEAGIGRHMIQIDRVKEAHRRACRSWKSDES